MKRLIQCYKDTKKIWQYYSNDRNPCECGCNCWHYEYDRSNNVIYAVCNCCNTDIYIVKDEYIEKKLNNGQWLNKTEVFY